MKIVTIGNNLCTPKNYSRKGKICSCLCPIISGSIGTKRGDVPKLNIERGMVKYEVEPKKESSYIPKLKKNQWATHEYWCTFTKIIELPKIFSKLDEEDYVVKTGTFTRDNIQMPCVAEILIVNVNKYLKIKMIEERRNKLNKIKNI